MGDNRSLALLGVCSENLRQGPSPYHPFPLFPLPGEREEGEGSWGEGYSHASINSLELRVFFLGLFQDGKVRVGVFPKSEKILIRGARLRSLAL